MKIEFSARDYQAAKWLEELYYEAQQTRRTVTASYGGTGGGNREMSDRTAAAYAKLGLVIERMRWPRYSEVRKYVVFNEPADMMMVKQGLAVGYDLLSVPLVVVAGELEVA